MELTQVPRMDALVTFLWRLSRASMQVTLRAEPLSSCPADSPGYDHFLPLREIQL